MPKQRKTCRVCGKSYEACQSVKSGDGVFNWREVACSPECGAIYFQRVMEARGQSVHNDAVERVHTHKKKKVRTTEAEPFDVEIQTESVEHNVPTDYTDILVEHD